MSIDAENQLLTVSKNWAATPDVFTEQAQSVTIHWQHPLATTFLVFGPSFLDLDPALGAEHMASAKSLSALGAGQL
jgi:hypothetical protein